MFGGRKGGHGEDRGGKRLTRLSAITAATAMVIVGAGTSAARADETHLSEGYAQVIASQLLALELADVGTSQATYTAPENRTPEPSPLNVGALGAIDLGLPNISLPLAGGDGGGLLELGGASQLGAAGSVSVADTPWHAYAGAGTLTQNGTVNLDPANEPNVDPTTLELTALLGQLGLSGLTDGIVDQLALQLGAVASQAELINGELESEYMVADLKLLLHSDTVGGLTQFLQNTVTGVGTTLEPALSAQGLLDDTLAALNVDLGLLELDTSGATVSVSGLDAALQTISDELVGAQLTGGGPDGTLVTIDLSDGTITVDLEQLYADGDLNGLDPNTSLLTADALSEITQTITDLLGGLTSQVLTSVQNAIDTTTVNVHIPVSLTLASGDVLESELLNMPLTDVLSLAAIVPGTGALVGTINGLIGTLGAIVPGLTSLSVGTILGNPLLSALVSPLTGLVDLIASGLSAALGPVVTAQVDVNTTLGELADGVEPTVALTNVQVAPGLTGPVLDLLGVGSTDELLASVTGPIEGALAGVVSTVLGPMETSVAGLLAGLEGTLNSTIDPLLAGLDPLLAALENVLKLTINHQPTLLGEQAHIDGPNEFTVNALTVELLNLEDVQADPDANPLVDLSLASSSVHALAYTPDLNVVQTEVDAGDTIDITSTGWPPSSEVTVDVTGADGTSIGTFTAMTDADGAFTTTFDVPVTAATGTYTVTGSIDASAVEIIGDEAAPITASDTVQVVDTTDPIVEITSPELVDTLTPTITGTVNEPAATVEVVVTGPDGEVFRGDATVDPDTGDWTIDATLPAEGEYTVTATATDAAGNTGEDTQPLVVDTTAPVVEITSPEQVDTLAPAISGTLDDPTAAVEVVVTGPGGEVFRGDATVDPDTGDWTIDATLPDEGEYTVTATATDPAGNTGEDAQPLVVDTTAPAVEITSPELVDTLTPTISGTLDDPTATVEVVITGPDGEVFRGDATVDPDTGDWTIGATLPDEGEYTVTATATDPAGNTGEDTQQLVADTTAPAVEITSPEQVDTLTPTISGTLDDPTAAVEVVITGPDGEVFRGDATVDPDTGDWTIDATLPAEGEYTVTATATDPAGNTGEDTQPLTVDTTAPAVDITSPELVNTLTPTISGTLDDPTATVEVVVTGPDGEVFRGDATVDPDTGDWTIDATLPAEGEYTVTATATDAAGNTGEDTQQLVADTTAPVVDIASPSGGESINDTTPTISGTLNDPTATVEVIVTGPDGEVFRGDATVDPDTGDWTIDATALPEGDYTVTATATDAAGNTATDGPVAFTVDLTAPAVDITSPTEGEVTADPVIEGTSEPGATVAVTVTGPDGDVPGTVETDPTTGDWTFTPDAPLAEGDYTVEATATDEAGNTATDGPVSFTVDTTAPAIDITSPTEGEVTNAPVFEGTSEPAAAIVVTVTGVDGVVPGTVTANGLTGEWTFTPDAPLAEGDYTVEATATDEAGNTATDGPVAFTVDLTAPAVDITSPTEGEVTNAPVFEGTSEPGTTVDVDVVPAAGGDPIAGVVTTDPDTGAWTFTPDAPLGEGDYTVTATATDPAGNTATDGPVAFTVDVTAPTVDITSPAEGEVTNAPVFEGTSEPGTTVEVTVTGADGAVPGTVTTDPTTGDWTFTPDAPLTDGDYTVEATATDGAGNTATDGPVSFTVDATAPAIEITSPTDGQVTNAPQIEGTSEPGSDVVATVTGPAGNVTGTLAVDPTTGDWTFTPDAPLAEGDYTVEATATDEAGNTATDGPVSFTVDTTAPTVAITSPTDGYLTNDPATVEIAGTSDSGTGEPSEGAAIAVTVTGADTGAVAGTVDVDAATGDWTFTPADTLADDVYTVTATATDPAGNVGTATPVGFEVDAVGPDVEILTPLPGTVTNDPASIEITGSSDPGSDVSVTLTGPDGDVPGTVTTDATSGDWTFTPDAALTEGEYAVVATAEDEAGNTGEDGPVAFEIDLTDPTVDITSPTEGELTNAPAFEGTSEPSTTVTVTVTGPGGDVPGTVTTDPDTGAWTFTPDEPLTDGAYTVEATATDAAGNTAEDGPVSFTVDVTAPAVAITSPTDGQVTDEPTFTGTSEPGSDVVVTVTGPDGDVPGTTTVDPTTGEWTFTPDEPLADGEYTVTATATDEAGNTGEDGPVAFEVDTTAPAVTIDSPAEGDVTNAPVFEGTSEPGSDVVVTVTGPDGVVPGTVTVDPQTGDWTFTPDEPLTDGAYTVTATATDEAGNSATDGPVSFTVDLTAPTVAITSPADGTLTNAPATLSFRGISSGADTVDVSVSGAETGAVDGTVVLTDDGSWTFTPMSALADDRYTIEALATDEAGNTADAAPVSFTVDTTPPGPVTIDEPDEGETVGPTPTISGECEPGATVWVSINGAEPVAVECSEDGTWQHTPAQPLPNGPATVVAVQEDEAGNVSEPVTREFVVDALAPAAPVITSPSNGDEVTDVTPTIEGTGEPGATVTVIIRDGAGHVTEIETVVDPDGTWSVTPTTPLAPGEIRVVAVQTDAFGNTSAESEPVVFDIVVLGQAPAGNGNGGKGGLATTGVDAGGTAMIALLVLLLGAGLLVGTRRLRGHDTAA